MMPFVLVTDHPGPDTDLEARMLDEIGRGVVVAGADTELLALVADADAILTNWRQVPPEVVRAGLSLKVIGRYGVGLDNIAVETATELGIPVTNVPVYCVDEVAEHTIALLMTLARRTAFYDGMVRAGDWGLVASAPMHRLAGATIGIVGFGHIGKAVAARAVGLGLQVLVADRSATQDEVQAHKGRLTDLDTLMSDSDVVTLHIPLTPETRHLIDASRLALMRRSAFILNCARGAVIDIDALAEALTDHRIAGAGIDVFEPERLPLDHPLRDAPNLVMTPHVAFYSEESILDLRRQATQNVIDVLSGRSPADIANADGLRARGGTRT